MDGRRQRIRTRTRKGASSLLTALLLLAPSAGPARAQDFGIPPTTIRRAPLPDHARLMLPEQGRPVELTLISGERLQGHVGPPEASQFILVLGEGSLMDAKVGVAWPRISKVRVDRSGAFWQGLLMGGAAGAVSGYLSPPPHDPSERHLGVSAPGQVWDAALQGAIIGAAAGLLHGLDLVLDHGTQGFGTIGTADPSRPTVRPAMRLVQTSPATSVTLRDVRRSLAGSPVLPSSGLDDPTLGQAWNGRSGATLALETSFPLDTWWIRGRTEWTTLPATTQVGPTSPSAGGGTAWYELSREYQAWRWLSGFALPIGPVGRLPIAEFSFLAGIEKVTVSSTVIRRVQGGTETGWTRSASQKEWRPLLMAGASLSVVRRPDVAVAVRLEGIMGPGLRTNALFGPSSELLLDRHRITPIGVGLGIEMVFPNF